MTKRLVYLGVITLALLSMPLVCPSAFAQFCPTVLGSPAWHRVDPSWNTRAHFDSRRMFNRVITNPLSILNRFQPAAWGGEISDFSVSNRSSIPHVAFRYTRTGISGIIEGDVYHCPIHYTPRGSTQRCDGQRLWFDLQRSGGDLEGIVAALVVDFCVTNATTAEFPQRVEVNTISTLLEGDRYNTRQFFMRVGPYAARMMQAQSAEIMNATLAAYERAASASPEDHLHLSSR